MESTSSPGNKLNSKIKLDDSPFYIVTENKEWKRLEDKEGNQIPNRAGISSFGFGGANAHVLIEEYLQNKEKIKVDRLSYKSPFLFILSTKNKEVLIEYVKRILDFIKENDGKSEFFINLIYNLQTKKEEMDERLAIIVNSKKELEDKLLEFYSGNNEIKNLFQVNIQKTPQNFKLLTENSVVFSVY